MFTGFTNTPSSLFQIHREKIVGERDNFPWLFFFQTTETFSRVGVVNRPFLQLP